MSGLSQERLAPANGIELAYQEIGDPNGQPVLLIMGLAVQMIGWDEEFCAMLAERGFRVVRFDNRDIGHSTMIESAGVPSRVDMMFGRRATAPYLLSDMATDTASLMDHLGIDAAHLVGVSMGGMIAQTMAIEHPERLLSLTSIMSTTGDRNVGRPSPAANELLFTPAGPSVQDAVDRMVLGARTYGSPDHVDPDRLAAIATAAYERCFHPEGTARQLMAITASGDRTEQLRSVRVPTLVIHGDRDGLVDVSGGIATAEAIPGARLAILEGMGHDLPPAYWDRIVELVAEHAAAATGTG